MSTQTTFWDAEHMKDEFNRYMLDCEIKGNLADIKGFCLFTKMPSSTFYNIVDNPEFMETIKFIYDSLQYNLINKGYQSSNSRFIEFMLKNRFSKDFNDKQTIEHVNTNDTIESIEDKRAKLLNIVSNQ